jgi:aromatic ring-opening dioxygenase LigB subunit
VAPDAATGTCVDLGQSLAGGTGTVALLVVADGSARRSLKAPGWFDARAAAFDAAAERAVRSGDLDALLDLDPDLACALQATGRSSWQVLAGAAGGSACTSRLGYADAPFGVGYLVATLRFP